MRAVQSYWEKSLHIMISKMRARCHHNECTNTYGCPQLSTHDDRCLEGLDLNTSILWEVANITERAMSGSSSLEEARQYVGLFTLVVSHHKKKYEYEYELLMELDNLLWGYIDARYLRPQDAWYPMGHRHNMEDLR